MENSWRSKKRAVEDLVVAPDDEGDTDTHGIIASTSSLTANAPNVKRGTSLPHASSHFCLFTPNPVRPTVPLSTAKRAETRECPICGDHIPLRLLGQHFTLESARVQTILDHVGDLDAFSDPHAPPHAPYVRPLLYPDARLTSTGPSRVVAPPLLKPPTPPPSSLRASPRLSAQ